MRPSDDSNILTVDVKLTESAGSWLSNDENQYEWVDHLCILRPSDNGRQAHGDIPQRFISIGDSIVYVREMDKMFGPKIDESQSFFKMRVGMKPGSSWCKILDWELEDYESVLNNEQVMYKLRHMITPNPTYIDEMISILRELKINKLIENGTNT